MSTDDTAPPGSAPTPPQEERPSGAYANYVPHDVSYSKDFEDGVMRLVTGPAQPHDGIRIIPDDSAEIPVEGVSVKASAVSLQSLPALTESDLPLPLDDPRRIFASAVPGIRLTHPGGYLEGGPGLDPDMDSFADDFLARNAHATTAAALRAAQAKEMEAHVEELKERMQARKGAMEHNERIERDLQAMQEEHALERKVHKQLAEKRRAKKEAKEKEKGRA